MNDFLSGNFGRKIMSAKVKREEYKFEEGRKEEKEIQSFNV